jgi:LacI family transcriptional regulator
VVDNEGGAREATAHLLELGHRRVGLLVADTDWTTDAGRLRGYRAGHAEAGVPVDERLVLSIGFHAPDAEERIDRLVAQARPTAVFAANNLLAEQAWNVLRGRGLANPRDVSLVAFDDLPWMQMVDPPLTAVAQPTVEMGRRAAQLILRRLAEPASPPAVECLDPLLVVRRSTAAPPA